MKRLPPFLLLFAALDALAHPGHGQPGWFHAHAQEAVIAAVAACAIVFLLLRARSRGRRARDEDRRP